MTKTFYFGKSGEIITEAKQKEWLNYVGKILNIKGKKYLIQNIKFNNDFVEVTGEVVL